jgi:5-methylcytosine-specific restriction endonuclease McrA
LEGYVNFLGTAALSDLLVHCCALPPKRKEGGIVDELALPLSPDDLTKRLQKLHEDRRTEQGRRKTEEKEEERRHHLNPYERKQVWDKTAGHCHLCGGDMNQQSDGELPEEQEILPHFVVDHVVPYASGGSDSIKNFLPAHGLCNGCRWFYSPEEFQWVLRMGVWARKQMEDATEIGRKMREPFLANEVEVRERRKKRQQD